MASLQCTKPAEQTCDEGHKAHSFSEKVSEMTSRVFKGHNGNHNQQAQTQTQFYESQTKYTEYGVEKSELQYSYVDGPTQAKAHAQTTCPTNFQEKAQYAGNGLGNTSSCHQKKRGEHRRRGLLQKIKDGLSGHSDSDGSSSESESENERCEKRKN